MTIGGGEAADQMVRMMLSGGEVTVRLAGSALKNLLALTMALAKDHKVLSGKVSMGKMLKETRDLRLFPMTRSQYKQFRKLAKKQKILFSAIKDRDDKGRLVDVVLPVTELDRANLIFERILYRGGPAQEDQAPEREQPPERERPERSPDRERETPQRAREGPQEGRSEGERPAPQSERESPSGREFRPEWQTEHEKLPDDPWDIPPKKDPRWGRDSPDIRTRSSSPRTSSGGRTTSDRPSVLGRLQAYREQLDQRRESVPTRDKSRGSKIPKGR